MGEPCSCTRLRIQITFLEDLLAAIHSASNLLSTAVLKAFYNLVVAVADAYYLVSNVTRAIRLVYERDRTEDNNGVRWQVAAGY